MAAPIVLPIFLGDFKVWCHRFSKQIWIGAQRSVEAELREEGATPEVTSTQLLVMTGLTGFVASHEAKLQVVRLWSPHRPGHHQGLRSITLGGLARQSNVELVAKCGNGLGVCLFYVYHGRI